MRHSTITKAVTSVKLNLAKTVRIDEYRFSEGKSLDNMPNPDRSFLPLIEKTTLKEHIVLIDEHLHSFPRARLCFTSIEEYGRTSPSESLGEHHVARIDRISHVYPRKCASYFAIVSKDVGHSFTRRRRAHAKQGGIKPTSDIMNKLILKSQDEKCMNVVAHSG
jgi:hypothetical protein